MIQRKQSLWLLLATAFDATTFRFPIYSGDWMKDTTPAAIDLNANTTIWFTILTVLAGGLAFATIFLFKNRKMQLRFCFLGIFITLALLALYILEISNFYSGNIALWAIFYIGALIFLFLAIRGIRKDQKLIRSLDRLR
jgi:peptidoglycan/LPS O-acetylase OafA/YrhL